MAPVFDQGFELDRVRAIKMEDSQRRRVLGENLIRLLEEGARRA
jgi:hypothetical protein